MTVAIPKRKIWRHALWVRHRPRDALGGRRICNCFVCGTAAQHLLKIAESRQDRQWSTTSVRCHAAMRFGFGVKPGGVRPMSQIGMGSRLLALRLILPKLDVLFGSGILLGERLLIGCWAHAARLDRVRTAAATSWKKMLADKRSWRHVVAVLGSAAGSRHRRARGRARPPARLKLDWRRDVGAHPRTLSTPSTTPPPLPTSLSRSANSA